MNQAGSQRHSGPQVSSLHEGTPTTSDPARASTPFKPRNPIERLFSTYTCFRHPLLTSIGDDLVDSIIGPMPTQQFLDDFLPISCIPGYSRPRTFRKGCFQTTLDAPDELKMYDPFVSDCINCCPSTYLFHIRSSPSVHLPHGSILWTVTVLETRSMDIRSKPSLTYPFTISRSVTRFPQAAIPH